MLRSVSVRCLMAVTVLAIATSSMWAQTGTKSPATKTTTKKAEDAKYRRVPFGYGRAGLSPKQKEEIYAVRARYGTQIEELEKQIADLKAKESQEIDAVLTPDQLARVKAYFTERESEKKSKAATPKPETDSK